MNYTENKTEQKPKRNKKKIFLLGLGALGLGMLTFFSIRFWKKHKEEKAPAPTAETKVKKPTATATKAPNNPVKPKAGEKPKQTKAASPPPKAKVIPKPVNGPLLAKLIYAQVLKRDFTKTFDLLKAIRNTTDYSSVSNEFRKFIVLGVRQTLLNGLFNVFTQEKQKLALRKAFTAMGLKYDGKKWSLSGLDGVGQLITTSSTKVWKNPRTAVTVPINMVLGREVCKRGTFTLFENDKQYFLVESSAVKAYQA